MRKNSWFLALAVAFALVKCSSDNGGATATPDPNEGKTFTQAISAATGGTLRTDTGSASLVVPAGALASDTDLTLAVEAASGTEASVYKFGPDGTTFLVPVDLSIKYDGTPGDKKKAVLAWFNGTAWEEVPGSSVKDGFVKGPVSHFSKFSIILVGDDVVLVSECADVATGFKPCGGAVEGTWRFKDICMDQSVIGQNPFADKCPTARVDVEINWDAVVTFGTDGTYSLTNNGQTMSATYTIPTSCLVQISSAKGCVAGLVGDSSTCSVDGSNCVCLSSQTDPNENPNESGTFSVQGNSLVMTKTGSSAGDPAYYCRSGNQTVVEVLSTSTDSNGQPVQRKLYMVLEKQ